MVLRPHLLRYKGSVKKIDSQKMQQINKRMNDAHSEYRKAKIVPRGMMIVGLGAFITIATPFVYLSMKSAASASLVDAQNKESNQMELREGEMLMQIEESEAKAK